MAYSMLVDLRKLLPEEALIQLTDDEDLGTVNQERIDEAISGADAEIDAYCGTRYTVPFSTVPEIISKLSADITIYNLYSRRVDEVPPVRAERYKAAIKRLEGISKGLVSLGIAQVSASTESGGVETNVTDDDRIFTRDTMEGF